jgi:hypothetical protein
LIQGSPFAAALRTGLRGAADVNGDGQVTLPELYDLIYERTVAQTLASASGAQHPVQSTHLESAGEVSLVQLSRSSLIAFHGEQGLGHCYVMDKDEMRVLAELSSATEQVFLPRDDYVVKCVREERLRVAHLSLATPVSVGALSFTESAASSQLAKGSDRAPLNALSAMVGWASTERAPTLSIGYRRGPPDLQGSAAASVSGTGELLGSAGLGTRIPWWNAGGADVSLGLQVAALTAQPFRDWALGGGSFLQIDFGDFATHLRGYGRFDLFALQPLRGGALEARVSAAVGVTWGL